MENPQFDTSLLKACGQDVLISPLISIRRPEIVSVGNHVAIDPWFHCTTSLEAGDYVHISSHVSVIGGKTGLLKMGNFTNISTGGTIVCVTEKFLGNGLIAAPGIPDELLDERKSDPVIFEDFVNTGANVTVLPGITLGQGSVIGACSLVTQSTEPWTIYVGIPARPIKIRQKDRMIEFATRLGYKIK